MAGAWAPGSRVVGSWLSGSWSLASSSNAAGCTLWVAGSWPAGSWVDGVWALSETDERVRGGTTSTTHKKRRRKPEVWDWPEREQRRLYADTALPTVTRVSLDTQDSDEDDLLALLLTGII